ncbi:MAG: hypothetical protein JWM86_1688, partial [Thermoleophilia bacterium]|nr:hypothetical protein [Thermoleophilia bacterium]
MGGTRGTGAIAPAASAPVRVPPDGDPARAPLASPPTAVDANAQAQAAADPLRPTAADGWSPDRVVAVHSRNTGGFIGSAVNFALGGIDEAPGQRLSRGQVDRLAPFYATQFGLDETYVRGELAKVYLYVGGPSTTAQQAMTIGHHVYVPDEKSLRHIMEPSGRGWLAHELAHTMQFLAYQGGSPHAFLADYFNSMVIGQDPQRPGSGDGPAVWGAIFTGLRSAGHPEEDLGKAATTFRDRLVSSVLPASAIALPVALVGSGLLASARATTNLPLLGTGRSLPLAMSGIAAPAIAGSLIGSFSDRMGDGWTRTLGAVAGGGLAGAALWKAGAFSATLGQAGVHTFAGRLGRGGALGLAIGATVSGAAIGLMSATASANTIKGWSNSAQVLTALRNKPAGEAPKDLTFQDALHDSHWIEIDAESVARR